MIKSILIVGLGSCAGGILRYLVSLALPPRGSGFPTATFIVNIAGCLLIGLLYGLFSKYSETPSALCLLLTTGLCGGFTTFSTFSNEAVTMLQGGNILYVIGSVICGILATLGGYALIRLL